MRGETGSVGKWEELGNGVGKEVLGALDGYTPLKDRTLEVLDKEGARRIENQKKN